MADLRPQTIDFAERAPVRIDGSAVIDGTPEEVWAVLTDDESWPRWFGPSLVTCRATTDPPGGVGSHREVVLKGGLRFDERFIAWEPGRLWAFTVVEGPGVFRSLVERCTLIVEGDGRTRADYRMAFEPKPFLRPLLPLVRAGVAKALAAGMAGLAAEVRARRS